LGVRSFNAATAEVIKATIAIRNIMVGSKDVLCTDIELLQNEICNRTKDSRILCGEFLQPGYPMMKRISANQRGNIKTRSVEIISNENQCR
jgi:hypothetical protein